ncbi:MAG: cyclic nucleotide-binding domain-containing protein [Planctomycetales bacterium]
MPSLDDVRNIRPADVPLGPPMTVEELAELIAIPAFSGLEPKFRQSTVFRNILATHTRRVAFREGDVIIRVGDWGNSAFLVISGEIAVEAGNQLPDDVLGRQAPERLSLFQAVSQLWRNHSHPEYRDAASYFSEDGQVGSQGDRERTHIYLQDVPGVLEKCKPRRIAEGSLFGESAALGRIPRTATCIATGDVEVLEIRWQGLRDILRKDSGFREKVEQGFRANALETFLNASPLFQHLDEEEMSELVEQARLETYGEYDQVGTFKNLAQQGVDNELRGEPIIAKEGDHPQGVVLIRSGVARVSQRHHHGQLTLTYLTPGKAYGFEELEEGFRASAPVPLKHSLRAIGYVMTVVIPTPLIEKHLLQIRKSVRATRSAESVQQMKPEELGHVNQDFVEFLVQQRFVTGTATMLIDLERCTRCDDCVKACAAAHDGNPRFVRGGPIHGSFMVAQACLHCQDPVCTIECPTGAISRRIAEGEVVINDDTCIGCGNCATNCPYDAVKMVEIRDAEGSFIRDAAHPQRMPVRKATKCDLCCDQPTGPACQLACPHDALTRTDTSNVEALIAWQNR